MDIVKGNSIPFDLTKILIVGPEKTGKTSFLATMPRPLLVFAGESNAERRLGGQPDIDFIRCYDCEGEAKGAGVRRFEKNIKELLTAKDVPYKTIAIDPLSFLSDAILDEIDRNNPGLRGSANTFKFYDMIKSKHTELLNNIMGLAKYVVVTSHVKLRTDETTGSEMFLSDLNGSIRDSIGGWFHAVLFTNVVPTPTGAKFTVRTLPDGKRKAGVCCPLGMENKIGKECEPSYVKLLELFKATPTTGGTTNASK